MSSLTPDKPMTHEQFQSAFDIVVSYTMTLAQAEKLTRAITIAEDQTTWSPDIDDIADQFYTANKAHQSGQEPEAIEMPYMGDTLSQLEKLGNIRREV
jgi:hypothetical protein